MRACVISSRLAEKGAHNREPNDPGVCAPLATGPYTPGHTVTSRSFSAAPEARREGAVQRRLGIAGQGRRPSQYQVCVQAEDAEEVLCIRVDED